MFDPSVNQPVDIKTPEISLDEMAEELLGVYKALKDQPPGPSDPGLTTREYAEKWGLANPTAKKRIRELDEAGLLIKGTGYRKRKDGSWYPSPVYRLKKKDEEEDATQS